MCGIAGFIAIDKSNFDAESVIKNMTNSLAHRGPDDMGFVLLSYSPATDRNYYVAFGHRRLKIIDLSDAGHQPMFNEQGDIGIIYNGEIYNYLELKDELSREGYHFVSTSDTEVLLRAYEKWGVDCFNKFNGMWALAIFDKKRKKVILSRDRFGKKPLYYYRTQDVFIFASEIKAILLHPYVIKEPNYEKIFRYISTNYRYVDIDEESYFKNIFQVPKGHFIEIDDGLNSKPRKYWNLSPISLKNDINDREASEGFLNLFVDSVRIRLRSDVPVGCLLSGGLDSSSIFSVARKILKKPVISFSGITGDVKGIYDESEYIDAVVKETNADSHYIRPEPADIFDTINEMLYFHDEPVCTVTWYSLYLIAKKVRFEYMPVLLNGHGGDELLAGYWDHFHYYFYELEKENKIKLLKEEIMKWKENHGRNPREIETSKKYINKFVSGEISGMSRFPDYSQCFNNDILRLYKKDISLKCSGGSLLSSRLYCELFFETVPASLRAEDRNTMSQSIESRSPWLDYRLVEYCFSLPDKFKIRKGLGKWILRESMRGILPEVVRTRKDKAGFIAPADIWFRTVNRNQIQSLMHSGTLEKRGLFNIQKLDGIFKEHLEGLKNHQMFLWQLINLELWFRRFFN